jgi:hypothetical protein
MALTGKQLTDYREREISDSRRHLEHLEKHGAGNTDAARTERSNIRFQEKQQLAEES